MKFIKIGSNNQSGFSLTEVLVAILLFSTFMIAYLTGHNSTVADSTILEEEVVLQRLAEQKLNEILLDPPELKESLLLKKDSGNFKDNKAYGYSVKWAKLEIPDLSQIQGKEDREDDGASNSQSQIEKMIFKKMKENIEKMIWQIQVTVKNNETGFNQTLSTWLDNPKAKLEVQIQ